MQFVDSLQVLSDLWNLKIKAAFQSALAVGISWLKFPTSDLQAFQVHDAKSEQKTLLTVTEWFVSAVQPSCIDKGNRAARKTHEVEETIIYFVVHHFEPQKVFK